MPVAPSLVIALLVGVAYAAGAWGANASRPDTAWRLACRVARTAFAASVGALGLWLLGPAPSGHLPGLSYDTLGGLLLVLVSGLGVVVTDYSRRYLDGEPRQEYYVAGLLSVLGSVTFMALASHWVTLVVAWAATSLAIHGLLVFYRERPFAVLAAHKKFIASRMADAALIAAAGLAWGEVGSGSFEALATHLATHGASTGLQVSGLLLVLAVILKTAQLPVHGWLIQVMEAPTPVSALLHAGVVNLGGFVLIRLAPLLEAAPAARGLLAVVGGATAILAGWVMLTRISIKVRLAWSTCAQMGFMLLECAAGLYELAVLHLVGHSLYKAHSFLGAGEAVIQAREKRMRPDPAALGMAPAMLAPFGAFGLVVGVQWIIGGAGNALWPLAWSALVALAWAPLFWPTGGSALRGVWTGTLAVAGLTALAVGWHALPVLPVASPAGFLEGAGGAILVAAFAAGYGVVAALSRPNASRRLSGLYRLAYAGFYLDEAFTRLTIALWPPKLPRRRRPVLPGGQAEAPAMEGGRP